MPPVAQYTTMSSPSVHSDDEDSMVSSASHNNATVVDPVKITTDPVTGVQLRRLVGTRIPAAHGEFTCFVYRSSMSPNKEHCAMVYGDLSSIQFKNVLIRIHSECFTGEVLGSLRCDCLEQLRTAQQAIADEGVGVVVYLRQEGRGIGLVEKMRAYNLQDLGYDTVQANLALGHKADARTYDEAVLILRDLGVESVRLLTNNQEKMAKMVSAGINVSERIPMVPKQLTKENIQYLKTKVEKMEHLIDIQKIEQKL